MVQEAFMKSTSGKLLVILGPTATGKTDLALQLASKFQGELVSADSRQVYKGLDIGTGKMPSEVRSLQVRDGKWIVDGINIHLYDVISPQKQYTVADYVKDAHRVIGDIRKRGKLPIIVGGTGFYLKALLYGLTNLTIPIDQKLRRKLEELSVSQLQDKLKEISYAKWESLNNSDRQNPRRLIRVIELEISPRRSSFDFAQDHLRGGSASPSILKVGLTAPREVLYQRVDERVVARIKQGMINEAKRLHKNGFSLKRMKQLGLEYGILADYLGGKMQNKQSLLARKLASKIHGFVRRQLTWFKKEKDVAWFDVNSKDFPKNVENLVTRWYYQS